MTDQPVIDQTLAPTGRQLLIGTAIAIAVAGILLVTVVMPAEYGVDPTRIGRLLGLTDLAATSDTQVTAAVMQEHERKYLSSRIDIDVKPNEELEYKAMLKQGEPLLYTWRVQGGPVYFEFHGEPTEGEWPEDYYRSYQIKEKSEAAFGSFVAPFTGQHGWYWKNLSATPIVITLEASGYYSRLGRIE